VVVGSIVTSLVKEMGSLSNRALGPTVRLGDPEALPLHLRRNLDVALVPVGGLISIARRCWSSMGWEKTISTSSSRRIA